MSARPTPGFWHVGGKDGTIIFAEDGFAVADATIYHGRHREGAAQANARLIAATPKLLLWLATICDRFEQGNGTLDETERTELELARALIAEVQP